ncbi:MAG TPA: PIG-L domain-containing protein [Planctomycetaceae bacterium]|nr:PIG-L domain-containing protein [Planctomycetaceae bacterium]
MAHPDDAEFQCAGTLIRLADAGWEVHIATLTAGDCGTTSETPWDISSTRTREARQAASLLGATYHCLDERDGFVVYDKPTLAKCVDLLRRIAPSLVFTHPAKDYMMDHEMTSLLCRAATFLYAMPNASAHPAREDAAVPWLYYTDPMDGVDPLGVPVAPTTLVDITEQLDRKTEMLAAHASQRDWLRAHHGTDEYLDSMRRHAALRGQTAGAAAAEAFVQHRGHGYPRDDLLAELFGASRP